MAGLIPECINVKQKGGGINGIVDGKYIDKIKGMGFRILMIGFYGSNFKLLQTS